MLHLCDARCHVTIHVCTCVRMRAVYVKMKKKRKSETSILQNHTDTFPDSAAAHKTLISTKRTADMRSFSIAVVSGTLYEQFIADPFVFSLFECTQTHTRTQRAV